MTRYWSPGALNWMEERPSSKKMVDRLAVLVRGTFLARKESIMPEGRTRGTRTPYSRRGSCKYAWASMDTGCGLAIDVQCGGRSGQRHKHFDFVVFVYLPSFWSTFGSGMTCFPPSGSVFSMVWFWACLPCPVTGVSFIRQGTSQIYSCLRKP